MGLLGMKWMVVVLVLLLISPSSSNWIQPPGYCLNYTRITSDQGKLSNEGFNNYSPNTTCTWEIYPTTNQDIYYIISYSSIPPDSLSVNGQIYNGSSKGDFSRVSSPMVVYFSGGKNGTYDIAFEVYWQILMDTPERLQLIYFYMATNGARWFSNWHLQMHHCYWNGVGCLGNFSVGSLILPQTNLVGFIPQDFNLPSLYNLDLSYNELKGMVPPSILQKTPDICNLMGNLLCGTQFPANCFDKEFKLCSKRYSFINPGNSSNYTLTNSTKSPYVKVLRSRLEANLALESTYTKVVISGVIADIKMVQVYENSGNQFIDVDYYFPISPTAVVYGMQFVNDGNLVIAKLKRNEEAQAIFNASKEAGNTTALLENDIASILKLRIANIPPQKMLRIEIFYTELIMHDEGTYSFYYPSLIPPQYLYDVEGVNQDPSVFSCLSVMEIIIQLPFSLSKVTCPTHDIHIQIEKNTAYTQFATTGLTNDFLLEYGFACNEIIAGVIVYVPGTIEDDYPFDFDGKSIKPLEFATTNFFMSIIQSPKIEFIDGILVPREYIFIVDTSASMVGMPTSIANYLIQNLLSHLNQNIDLFNIISFSGELMVFEDNSVLATDDNFTKAINFISQTTIGGFSNLLPALKKVNSIPRTQHYSRIVTVITDGLISLQKPVLQFVHNNTQNANYYSIAIGAVPNRYLTQGIATIGRGKEFWIQKQSEVKQVTDNFIKHVLSPVLTNITLDFNPSLDVDLSTISSITDVLSDKPLIISGQYYGDIQDERLFTIRGFTSNGVPWQKDVFPTPLTTYSPRSLVYLWAGSKIRELEFTTDDEDLITNISLSNHILSKYTSFIAVETSVAIQPQSTSNAFLPLSLTPSVYSCMPDCPLPSCEGKCDFSFDGSSGYCPKCPSNQFCVTGRCEDYNCSCTDRCLPYSCNGVLCPISCLRGKCYGGICTQIPTQPCQGLCPPSYSGNELCGPCAQNFLCVAGKCFNTLLMKDLSFSSLSTAPPIPQLEGSCLLGTCNKSSTCDYDLQLCADVVNQNTLQECEGLLIGDDSYICDNGNFIYLSSSFIASSYFSLDGLLAVEGNIHFNSKSIMMTIKSLITAALNVSIPPSSHLIIDFLNFSLPEMPFVFNDTDGTKSIQILRSQNFIGNISSLQFTIINNPNPICLPRLKISSGLLLTIQDCEQSADGQASVPLPVVMGILFGVIGAVSIVGGLIFYWTNKMTATAFSKLRVNPTK